MSDDSLNALQCFSTRPPDQLDKESVGPECKENNYNNIISSNNDNLVIKKQCDQCLCHQNLSHFHNHNY